MNPEERIVGDKKHIMFFMDDNDKAVDKDHATKFIARVEDLNGNRLEETFGRLASTIPPKKIPEKEKKSFNKYTYRYYKCETGWYCRIGLNTSAYEILNKDNEWEPNSVLMNMYYHDWYDFFEILDPKLIRKLESYKKHTVSVPIKMSKSNTEDKISNDAQWKQSFENLKIKTNETKKAHKLYYNFYLNHSENFVSQNTHQPLNLANKMKDEYAAASALLNDMVKAGQLSIEDLRKDGFAFQVTDALSLLNNGKSILDLDYVLEIRKNPVARAVMAADIAMQELDQWTKFATKEAEREDLKRRFVRVLLEDDGHDFTGKRIQKRFQLDHERLFFLTVIYTDEGIESYSIDVEKASDSHYQLTAENGERLRMGLNSKLTLWEGLMLYLEDHGEGTLLSLMDRENIKYSQMHFTFWGDWDE